MTTTNPNDDLNQQDVASFNKMAARTEMAYKNFLTLNETPDTPEELRKFVFSMLGYFVGAMEDRHSVESLVTRAVKDMVAMGVKGVEN